MRLCGNVDLWKKNPDFEKAVALAKLCETAEKDASLIKINRRRSLAYFYPERTYHKLNLQQGQPGKIKAALHMVIDVINGCSVNFAHINVITVYEKDI